MSIRRDPDWTDPDNPEVPSAAFEYAVAIPPGADAATVRALELEAMRRYRGAQRAPTKIITTVRLAPQVMEYYRASGKGWQTRMNADLERLVSRRQRKRPARRAGATKKAPRRRATTK